MRLHVAWLFLTAAFVAWAAPRALAQSQHDPLALAAIIDARIEEQLDRQGIEAVPLASDAEFVRRVYLDLVGCIPSAGQARDFIADDNPSKREALIEELLGSSRHLSYYTDVWYRWLMPELDTNSVLQSIGYEFQTWLRKQLSENVPYDEFVRRIITVPLPRNLENPYEFYSSNPDPKPTAFFASNEVRPAGAATRTTRLFLGVRLDCAQCHDHPDGEWKQEQFWSFAAFYRELEPRKSSFFSFFVGTRKGPPMLTIPNAEQKVTATFLDGTQPNFADRSPRELLADWIIDSGNPYFSRAAVNRIWSHFFGRGLINPIDNIGSSAATHPELLQQLADAFRDAGYDQRFLMRAILNSRTYQRSSIAVDARQLEPEWYARSLPRKMNGYQLYESICQAAGSAPPGNLADMQIQYEAQVRERLRELVETGGDSSINRPTSLLEALTLMNGSLVMMASGEEAGPLLGAIVDLPGLSDEERITTLFFATLTRKPTAAELEPLMAELRQAADETQRRSFFSDLMWVLLNSSEFAMNH